MGIARGAWLVGGSWLDACLVKGAWVDEAEHTVEVCIRARHLATRPTRRKHGHTVTVLSQGQWGVAAAKARAALGKGAPRLLEGWAVHVAGPTPTSTAGNVLPLRKLVMALGGLVVPASQCRVCVLTAPESPVPVMASGCAVVEDWLLESTISYSVLNTNRFETPQT